MRREAVAPVLTIVDGIVAQRLSNHRGRAAVAFVMLSSRDAPSRTRYSPFQLAHAASTRYCEPGLLRRRRRHAGEHAPVGPRDLAAGNGAREQRESTKGRCDGRQTLELARRAVEPFSSVIADTGEAELTIGISMEQFAREQADVLPVSSLRAAELPQLSMMVMRAYCGVPACRVTVAFPFAAGR
jgi:hypothetical protein